MKNILFSLLLLSGLCAAQNETFTSPSSKPFVYTGVLASIPATCRVGTLSFITDATAGQQIYECSATNTWTQQLNSGSGGASTALDNLASVNINTALLFQATKDIGSAAKPARDLYLYGTGTYGTTSIKFTGVPTGARVWTVQDTTDTFVGLGTTDTLTNKTLTTPTIGSFANATHNHGNAAGGGTLAFGTALTNLSGFAVSSGSSATTAGKIDVVNASQFCADAGANDTYTCSLSPAISAYVTGTHYRFKANTANTGAASINFNSVGACPIKKAAGGITTDPADNDIRAGQWVDVVYDGTNCQMQSTLGNAASGSGTVTVVGAGNLTSTAIVTGGGTQTVQTPSSGATVDSSGNIVAASFSSSATNGGFYGTEGTGAGVTANIAAGVDVCYWASTGNGLKCSFNNDTASVLARKSDKLSVFAATSSSELAGVLSDEVGSGAAMFSPKQDLMDAASFCAAAGSNTTTYTCSLSPAITAYVTGTHYRFKADVANTAASTINLNSLGAKTIKKAAGGVTTDIVANDLRAGQWVDLVYDGTNMQMQSLLGNPAAGGSTSVTTMGDLQGYDTAAARVPVGANGKVLQAVSTAALGVSYTTVTRSYWYPSAFRDPGTARSLWSANNGAAVPTPGCSGSTGHSYCGLDYSTGAEQMADFMVMLPLTWSSGTSLDIRIAFTVTSGAGSNVVWRLYSACVPSDNVLDVTYNAVQSTSAVVPTTANKVYYSTLTGLTQTSCVAGNIMFIKVARTANANGDTTNATASNFGATVSIQETVQ